MSNTVEELGQVVFIQGSVDRMVVSFMLRALLIDASTEKRQACLEILATLRTELEAMMSNAAPDNAQHVLALNHFEKWELEIENQIQKSIRS